MKFPKEFRWTFVRTLGSGGQATVAEVSDSTRADGARYALKALTPTKPKQAFERFRREVAALHAVRHNAVVRVIDQSSPEAEFQYYVMELVPGARTIKSLLGSQENPYHRRALPAVDFFAKLVEAIAAWESVGIIHRDLSPGNVLVTPSGDVKVIDFGICQIEGEQTITLADEGVGTQNYMSPECEAGSAGRTVSTRADLYSAGKILWSLVAHERAFAREAPAFNQKSMKALFPWSPDLWHLQRVLEKSIRHDPSHRWKSAAAALEDVARIRYLISAGRPPLELFADACPLCGVGTLKSFQGQHMVYGNPPPSGIVPGECDHCHFTFAVKRTALMKALGERQAFS